MKVKFRDYEGEIAGCYCNDGHPYFIVALPGGTFMNAIVSECTHPVKKNEEPEDTTSYFEKVEKLKNIICENFYSPDNPREAAIALISGGKVTANTAATIARLFGRQRVKGKKELIKALQDGEIEGRVPEMRSTKYRKWSGHSCEPAIRMQPTGSYVFDAHSLVAWLAPRYGLQVRDPELIKTVEWAKGTDI